MNRRVMTQCFKIYTSALRRLTTSSPNLATLRYAEKVEASKAIRTIWVGQMEVNVSAWFIR